MACAQRIRRSVCAFAPRLTAHADYVSSVLAGSLEALGGLGLFILGMLSMTHGLRALAGSRLREALTRFTRSPASGAVTGALTTALVQSSSATVVAAVGFVGAQLLTFPQALGIIFGANVGTTITGWVAALLGFKVKLGRVVLPLLFVAAGLKLSGGRRRQSAGDALAGFCLLFVGIGTLQSGLAGFEGTLTSTALSGASVGGRLALLGLGVVLTLVTQSSSAGVAAALAAVHTGALALPQAMAMVIGMDVGTTATAALATVGGNGHARRTGLAHVVYNVLTGIAAFALLDPYLAVVHAWSPALLTRDPEVALVAFHTTFNLLGVVVVLPWTSQFARFIERMFPLPEGSGVAERLDPNLRGNPEVAVAMAHRATGVVAAQALSLLSRQLRGVRERGFKAELQQLERDVTAVRGFLDGVDSADGEAVTFQQQIATFHALDHIGRLLYRCSDSVRLEAVGADEELKDAALALASSLEHDLDAERLLVARSELWELHRDHRARQIRAAAAGDLQDGQALAAVDAGRWLARVGHHVARIAHYTRPPGAATPASLESPTDP